MIFHYGSYKNQLILQITLITLLLYYFGQTQFHRELQGVTLGWLLSFHLQSSLLMFTLMFSSSLTLF